MVVVVVVNNCLFHVHVYPMIHYTDHILLLSLFLILYLCLLVSPLARQSHQRYVNSIARLFENQSNSRNSSPHHHSSLIASLCFHIFSRPLSNDNNNSDDEADFKNDLHHRALLIRNLLGIDIPVHNVNTNTKNKKKTIVTTSDECMALMKICCDNAAEVLQWRREMKVSSNRTNHNIKIQTPSAMETIVSKTLPAVVSPLHSLKNSNKNNDIEWMEWTQYSSLPSSIDELDKKTENGIQNSKQIKQSMMTMYEKESQGTIRSNGSGSHHQNHTTNSTTINDDVPKSNKTHDNVTTSLYQESNLDHAGYQRNTTIVLEWFRNLCIKLAKVTKSFDSNHDGDGKSSSIEMVIQAILRIIIQPMSNSNNNNISKQNGNGDQSNHSVSDDMIANEILDMFGFDDEVIGITQEIMSRKDELIVAMRERITSLRRDDWKEGHSSHDNGSDNHNRSYQPGSQVSINVSSDKQFDKLKRSDMHFTTIEVLFLIYLS